MLDDDSLAGAILGRIRSGQGAIGASLEWPKSLASVLIPCPMNTCVSVDRMCGIWPGD